MRESHGWPALRKAVARTNGLVRWTVRQRRAAAGHLLRGACYGIGTGAASILVLWIQEHL
ncbi:MULTISPECIES: hypothetical protein [Streptomyces]|uniref:Uncharacterized protein n=2 Tax=Streptomyces rimosus TaxID=1927 RepID=A0A8F7KVR6_STRRM|nr:MULTISPECIES: hypothetical protein [Streptomyces]KOG73038.1 hypothetical protein ADK78_17370 [Kitasatospora aureofaciens]MYT42117.1 hypothetical protein [Streptomyces sp. SID5471]KEF04799.1 hypothetical protein DF17_21360 [Streptomyces rimosus]KOT32416.1 hypothetical protein ADK84_27945 [Streptomyces sp. NRRL WC-3701]KOT38593.1 hypothetical protein ADK42_16650 [Streptomyces rimosus subsp. rimosus]